jgi:lysophospholipase L1-like esterase
MKNIKIYLLTFLVLASAWTFYQANRPTIYLIGDSTVKNGKGKGDGGLWGWGNYLSMYFDTTKIAIENDALGGTSSRTFQTKGLWDKVLVKIKPGDYVIMQFGHNDSSPLVDSTRARGTIKGVGNESQELYNPLTKKQEVIYTYGWYMRKFINDTKAKGATPIICSPVPRNNWKDGKIVRDSSAYAKWAKEIAIAEHIEFIPLNELISNQYDKMGQEIAGKTMFTTTDHTHTSLEGAKLNAACVTKGIKELKNNPLHKYFTPDANKLEKN